MGKYFTLNKEDKEVLLSNLAKGKELTNNYQITFGKYKNRSIKTMLSEEEVAYCLWVLNNHFTNEGFKKSRKYKAFKAHLKRVGEFPNNS